MNDIWSIIGLSSLVASVVTVLVGIVKDIVVEKYRFKRQSEAGYIQKQIQMHSQIHFLLSRMDKSATHPDFFSRWEDDAKEINENLKNNSNLINSRFLNKWLVFFGLLQASLEGGGGKRRKESIERGLSRTYLKLRPIIKDMMNNNLIPKYRKIVGETVPDLD